MKLSGQDKNWCPRTVCSTCVEELKQWTKGEEAMRLNVQVIWWEQTNHSDDCYFCKCKVLEYSSKTRENIACLNLPSALRVIPHGSDVPVQSHPNCLDDVQLSSGTEAHGNEESDFYLGDESKEP